MIPFTCPHCGHHTTVELKFAGQSGPCVSCANPVRIPFPADADVTQAATATKASRKSLATNEKPWWITYGMILGGLVLLGAIIFAGYSVLRPAFEAARETAKCTACESHLSRIGGAIDAYHAEHGEYPPAILFAEDGTPKHSWRVLILPYLGPDARDVYERYDMSEAWDGPNNSKLTTEMPDGFQCPSDASATFGETSYMAVVGTETAINTERKITKHNITDGLHETMTVIEASGSAMNWLRPRDITMAELKSGLESNNAAAARSEHPQGVNALMADGNVVLLPADTEGKDLQGMATIAGNEYIEILDLMDY